MLIPERPFDADYEVHRACARLRQLPRAVAYSVAAAGSGPSRALWKNTQGLGPFVLCALSNIGDGAGLTHMRTGSRSLVEGPADAAEPSVSRENALYGGVLPAPVIVDEGEAFELRNNDAADADPCVLRGYHVTPAAAALLRRLGEAFFIGMSTTGAPVVAGPFSDDVLVEGIVTDGTARTCSALSLRFGSWEVFPAGLTGTGILPSTAASIDAGSLGATRHLLRAGESVKLQGTNLSGAQRVDLVCRRAWGAA